MNEVAAWVGYRSEATRRHRQKKRREGLCAYGGCKNESACYLCELHRPVASQAQKKYRETGGTNG